MSAQIKTIIAGASGAMGRTLLDLSAADSRFLLVGATDRHDSPLFGKDLSELVSPGVPAASIGDNPAIVAQTGDVFIDFTSPKATLAALAALKSTSVKVVIIGTTGFEASQSEEIATYANDFVIIKSGNFSLGVNLIAGFVKKAASVLGEDWDIEIIEAHHRRKVDAPSGTALLLGAAAADGRNKELSQIRTPAREGITGARQKGSIGFSAIRGGGIIGEHDVRFESDSESLILTHRAHDRSIFAKGALASAVWGMAQQNGLYDMADVLGLK